MIILHLYSQNSLLHTNDKHGQYEINRINMENDIVPVFLVLALLAIRLSFEVITFGTVNQHQHEIILFMY